MEGLGFDMAQFLLSWEPTTCLVRSALRMHSGLCPGTCKQIGGDRGGGMSYEETALPIYNLKRESHASAVGGEGKALGVRALLLG